MPIEYMVHKPIGATERFFNSTFATAAESIASWTKGEHMLPKSPQDIEDLFDKGHSVVVLDGSQEVGHAAITAVYPDDHIEIGGIVTHPDWRHKGVGTVATLAVLELAEELFPGYGKFALANSASAKLFERLGGKPLSTTELCSEVWEYCATCPMLPSQVEGQPFVCCDTPYDLSSLKDATDLYVLSWMSQYVWLENAYLYPDRPDERAFNSY